MKINWDALGIGASLACAIHCAVLPLLFTSFPLLGINILHNSWFEWGMIAIALVIGIHALRHGFRKHHHRYTPLALLVIGFVFLIAKEAVHALHTVMVVIAVTFIVTAHYLNYRFCRNANHCHNDDCTH